MASQRMSCAWGNLFSGTLGCDKAANAQHCPVSIPQTPVPSSLHNAGLLHQSCSAALALSAAAGIDVFDPIQGWHTHFLHRPNLAIERRAPDEAHPSQSGRSSLMPLSPNHRTTYSPHHAKQVCLAVRETNTVMHVGCIFQLLQACSYLA